MLDDAALRLRLKRLIVESLHLEGLTPETIADDAPLFGEGLGLDSVDALELMVALEQEYGRKSRAMRSTRASSPRSPASPISSRARSPRTTAVRWWMDSSRRPLRIGASSSPAWVPCPPPDGASGRFARRCDRAARHRDRSIASTTPLNERTSPDRFLRAPPHAAPPAPRGWNRAVELRSLRVVRRAEAAAQAGLARRFRSPRRASSSAAAPAGCSRPSGTSRRSCAQPDSRPRALCRSRRISLARRPKRWRGISASKGRSRRCHRLCASAALAIEQALRAVRASEVDIALAGGADCLCLTTYSGFNALRAVDDTPVPAVPRRSERDLTRRRRRGAHPRVAGARTGSRRDAARRSSRRGLDLRCEPYDRTPGGRRVAAARR